MKRAVAALVSLAIIAAIAAKVDPHALWANLTATRPLPFAAALFLFIPQNLISIWRWRAMASLFMPMSWGQATGLILAGNTMNIVLPSKMGDLTKAYFLNRAGAMDLPRALNLVVFEKSLDLGALCLLALSGTLLAHAAGVPVRDARVFLGLSLLSGGLSLCILGAVAAMYFIPPGRLPLGGTLARAMERKPRLRKALGMMAAGGEVMAMLQARHARRGRLCAASLLLWSLHLLQIWFFFVSLDAAVPPLAFASLMPLAIFVGLLPLTLFGMGTRDAAMIAFFSPYQPAAKLAAAGLYVSLRYLVPALGGLPFLNRYIAMAKPKPPAPDQS